jgi:hypothetical protein
MASLDMIWEKIARLLQWRDDAERHTGRTFATKRAHGSHRHISSWIARTNPPVPIFESVVPEIATEHG